MDTRCLAFTRLVVALVMFVPFGIEQSRAQTEQNKQKVVFQARLAASEPVIPDGLEWRIFQAGSGPSGNITELAQATGGPKAFNMEPGTYLVHASFGHAAAIRSITVGGESSIEEFIFNAGGLKLSATVTGGAPAPSRFLRFDIYEEQILDSGERQLIVRDAVPDKVVTLPVGTYHVVSRYGSLNATVRADLRVRPGKLTEASLQHRAANITFRLVRSAGGDAVADTAWSILTESGEVIKESNSTFPSMILSEGNYTAIAKHNDAVYSQDFKVRAGFNADLEVIAPN